MSRVEMDAHKLDGFFCVSLPSPDGDVRERIVRRLQVVVLIEVASRAVLGYHLSMAREPSKDDVLRAIKHVITKWEARTLRFSEEGYVKGAGFLSSLGPEFQSLCWDETNVDGALSETCEHVRSALKSVVGSELITPSKGFSSRRSLDDRPFIESFFAKLSTHGFQKLTNTTGGRSHSRKGRTPDKVAIESRFSIEWAEELLDVLIANYNATPHSSLSYDRSPLDQARYLFQPNLRCLPVICDDTETVNGGQGWRGDFGAFTSWHRSHVCASWRRSYGTAAPR